ncbi:MAG: BTAD domain-containing putative transcriptional regulator, partial [Cyanobacteria bacterium J06649_4]
MGVRSERLQALLAFLLLHRSAPQSRQSIAIALWPEASDASAKANLRRRLHDLKQKLPSEDWLHIDQKTVQWQSHQGFVLDVADFQASLSQASSLNERANRERANGNIQQRIALLKQAVSLYIGDLLPSCYDEWIEPYRDQLRQQQMAALASLIELLTVGQRVRPAIAYAQQLRQLDPLSESAYCHLMKLHDALGDRASALRTYHQCMTTLQEELGVDPSPDTRELYENILLEQTSPVSPGPTSAQPTSTQLPSPNSQHADISGIETAPSATDVAAHQDWGESPNVNFFHGRTTELQQLKQWLGDDRFCLIALLGIGGIGKTTLAAKVARDLQGEFDYVIWRSLRNAPPLEMLLNDLVPFLSNQQDTACSLSRLMHWLRQSRCLVILDNVETILKGGERAGQFREKYVGYGELLEVIGQANHQSCLVLTSREKPAEISTLEGMNLAVQTMQISGSPEAALALLEARGLEGTQEQKEQLSARYGNSPLAIQIVGGSIRDVFCSDIALFLEEDTLLFNGAKKLLDKQFARLTPLEKTVMTWLAINREWTSVSELMADIHPPCKKMKLLEAIESLRWRSLIENRANTYTQQPVVMEYVISSLLDAVGDELLNANTFSSKSYRRSFLNCYALTKTTVKDFIRESQGRLLLDPLVDLLRREVPDPAQRIFHFFKSLQGLTPLDAGYAAGNLINLGHRLEADFTDQNFSNFVVRHAYLQPVPLQGIDFSGTLFKESVFSQPMGPAFSLAYSHDGTRLAMGEGSGRVLVWRTSDWKPVLALKDSENWVLSVTFSHDDRWLVSEGRDHQLNVWDVSTGQLARTLAGHNGLVWSVNAHPRLYP